MSADVFKPLRYFLDLARKGELNTPEVLADFEAAVSFAEAKLAKQIPTGRPGEGHTLAELAKDQKLATSLIGRNCWVFNLATRRYRGVHPEKPVDKRLLAAFFNVPAALEVLGKLPDPENWFLELSPAAKGGAK